MANDVTGNPWTATATGALIATRVKVKAFMFNPGANSDDLIVHDRKGKVIWQVKAAGDITVTPQIALPFGNDGVWFDGITVNTIDAGTFSIYLA